MKMKQPDHQINYSFNISPFGELLIASLEESICFVWFVDDHASALSELEKRFPKTTLKHQSFEVHKQVIKSFTVDQSSPSAIKLHLNGTPFQVKVWQALLSIPFGGLCNYMDIAKAIDQPKASRAVGTAIGKNPIAFLIPCHRVVQTNGQLGGYRWGVERKSTIIKWEQASVGK